MKIVKLHSVEMQYKTVVGLFLLKKPPSDHFGGKKMKRTLIEDMSVQHQFVWNTLTMLDDGERILGTQLRQRAGVKSERKLYYIVEDLRINGYLVGGDKNGKKGYYQVRDIEDLRRTTGSIDAAAYASLKISKLMKAHFEEQNGVIEDGK